MRSARDFGHDRVGGDAEHPKLRCVIVRGCVRARARAVLCCVCVRVCVRGVPQGWAAFDEQLLVIDAFQLDIVSDERSTDPFEEVVKSAREGLVSH